MIKKYSNLCELCVSVVKMTSENPINTGDMAERRAEDDEILTVGQVSKLLKLHQRTIYKLVRNGMIPGRRVGKKWRFLRSEIMNFLVKRDV